MTERIRRFATSDPEVAKKREAEGWGKKKKAEEPKLQYNYPLRGHGLLFFVSPLTASMPTFFLLDFHTKKNVPTRLDRYIFPSSLNWLPPKLRNLSFPYELHSNYTVIRRGFRHSSPWGVHVFFYVPKTTQSCVTSAKVIHTLYIGVDSKKRTIRLQTQRLGLNKLVWSSFNNWAMKATSPVPRIQDGHPSGHLPAEPSSLLLGEVLGVQVVWQRCFVVPPL